MENPTPFDLNEAIRRWQEKLNPSPAFSADNREELASHLRASVQRLQATGISEEEAFQIATRRIGERHALESEFAKVNPPVQSSFPKLLFWTGTIMLLFRAVSSLERSISDFQMITHSGKLSWLPYSFLRYAFISLGGFELMLALAIALAALICLRSNLGIWKGFDTMFTFRLANWARTKPIKTFTVLIMLAVNISVMPLLSAYLAVIMSPGHGITVMWATWARGVSVHLGLASAIFYFARRIGKPHLAQASS